MQYDLRSEKKNYDSKYATLNIRVHRTKKVPQRWSGYLINKQTYLGIHMQNFHTLYATRNIWINLFERGYCLFENYLIIIVYTNYLIVYVLVVAHTRTYNLMFFFSIIFLHKQKNIFVILILFGNDFLVAK